MAARLPTGTWLEVLTRCPGDVGGHDVVGVTVETGPRTVVAHGDARVGMGGGLLHVTQWDPGIERRGDERVPKGMRDDMLDDPGTAGDPADN
jgi:hypothetical protein